MGCELDLLDLDQRNIKFQGLRVIFKVVEDSGAEDVLVRLSVNTNQTRPIVNCARPITLFFQQVTQGLYIFPGQKIS